MTTPTNNTIQWRAIPGYEHYYEVSDHGHIKRLMPSVGTSCEVLKPTEDSKGYLSVTLCMDGACAGRRIHRMVLLAFVGPSPLQVNHKDGNKKNNLLSNLEYTTPKENSQHSSRMGLVAHGSRQGNSKMTEAMVIEIRERLKNGEKQVFLAKVYGVTQSALSHMARKDTWNHLPEGSAL